MSAARVVVQDTSPELLAVMPEVGAFTCFHRSSQGTNFYEQGDDKQELLDRVINLANERGMSTGRVVDETQ